MREGSTQPASHAKQLPVSSSQPRANSQRRATRSSAQLAQLAAASDTPLPRAAENASVVHVSCAPLVLTLLAAGGANVGLLLDAAPDLVAALEPLRQTAELVATDVRATT